MTFEEILNQAMALLQRQGRVSYRALKRQFDLDEAYVEDLKLELIEVHQVAVDQDNTMLVWVGGAAAPPPAATDTASVQARAPDAAPLTYTPPHLTDKILAARPALAGERKQVTVLFADLKDSTELIRGLDPEAAQQLLDPAIHIMMDAVHRFEGTVNQVLGDGIMALFGAPIAHEDHALRACYAALAMQGAMQSYTGRCAAAAAWSCVYASASTQGRWWCGPLATTCTWTTRPSGKPQSWRRAWNRQRPRAPSASPPPPCVWSKGWCTSPPWGLFR
jgi:hypothetical protein